MKDFTVKDEQSFRLRVKMWKCTNPNTLNAVNFIQECKDKDGNVDFSSTYEFFMTDDELKKLAENLINE
jgi:hypothetical protein